MFYIILGVIMIPVIILVLLARIYTPESEMMSGFEGKDLKKFIITMTTITLLFISYGVYFQLTYQPPFIELQIKGKKYTVLGDIGNWAYYDKNQDLARTNKEITLHFVSWNERNLKGLTFEVHYPSGKIDIWKPEIKKWKYNERIFNEHGIKEIYTLTPFVFKETGKVLIKSKGNDDLPELMIDVYEKDYAPEDSLPPEEEGIQLENF